MIHFTYKKARLSSDYLPSWYLYENGKRTGIIVFNSYFTQDFRYFFKNKNDLPFTGESRAFRTLYEAKRQAIIAYVEIRYPELVVQKNA